MAETGSSERLSGAEAVGHLLRRAGFGLSPQDADVWLGLGFEKALDRLLEELAVCPKDPEGMDPYHPGTIQQVWLDRMVGGTGMLAEKLAFFWHGHFATSNVKVQDPKLMWLQYRLFRTEGAGTFPDLVLGVSRDVAMIRWLDGNANRKGVPNENYARELQELFTLGIGNYTEKDIREIARAFTGWGSRRHDFKFQKQFHDEGSKTFHGQTGAFDGTDVVRILTGLPACHTFIAQKLLQFFSTPEPGKAEVARLAEVFKKSKGDITDTLRALFEAPEFRDPRRQRVLVKSPVEFAVTATRAVGLEAMPAWLQGSMERMGQILFRPPSVKGWTSGSGWLGTGAMVERLKAGRRLAQATPGAAATMDKILFDGQVPAELQKILADHKGAARLALALGSPDFQLA